MRHSPAFACPVMLAVVVSLGVIIGPGTAPAQKPEAAKPSAPGHGSFLVPHPPYPPELLGRGVAETGIVRVTYEADGHVSDVVIVASFGRKGVDERTARFIKENWRSIVGKRAVREMTMTYKASHAYVYPR